MNPSFAKIVFASFLAGAAPAQNVITTVAGTGWLFPGNGRRALDAPIGGSTGLAVATDKSGNLYLSDTDNLMVMKVGLDGILTVIAGNGIFAVSGDGGPAVNAALPYPEGVAVDGAGNTIIADADRIRKVTPDGIITTMAGSFDSGFTGDGGPASKATFNTIGGVAVDQAGNIYVNDQYNYRIRKITPDGSLITTVAGNGQSGNTGNGGPATAAAIYAQTFAVDPAGIIYIGDPNSFSVRRVSTDGTISLFAGGGLSIDEGIPASQTAILPVTLAADASGNVFVGDYLTNTVRKIDSRGIITTVAGSGKSGYSGDGGSALRAALTLFPYGSLATDAAGNLYIGDGTNNRVRRVAPSGRIDTVAGNGQFRVAGNGGPATSATLYDPSSVASDARGNVYIAEPFRGRVRKIDPAGTLSVFAGSGDQGYSGDGGPATAAATYWPWALAVDALGNVYIGEQVNSVIRRVDASGIITTIAGTGSPGYGGDGGPAAQAQFAGPAALAFDAAGSLFVADSQNHRIRRIAPNGVISTIAGIGQKGFSGDGGPALRAALSGPSGVAADNLGNVYFSDTGNQRVRRIAKDGTISTIAGNGRQGYAGDNGPATSASLDNPQGLALDSTGNLYVADTNNARIRQITPSGTISTVAGTLKPGLSGDGGPATAAQLLGPFGATFDSAGNLLIADTLNHRVRAVLAKPPSYRLLQTGVSLTGQEGREAAATSVGLVSSVPGLAFTATATTVGGGGWLQFTPSAGSMPAVLRIAPDASSLAPGTYRGSIAITAPNAAPPVQSLSVTLVVTPAGEPVLSASPEALNLTFAQRSAPASQAVRLENRGGGTLEFTATAATAFGGGWLTVTPTSGTAAGASPASLTVSVDPASLDAGTYSGQIVISNARSTAKVTVPVTITVSPARQTILIPQSGLTFTVVAGGGGGLPQNFGVQNLGTGQMRWTATGSTLAGGNWLALSTTAGSTDAASSDVPRVGVSVNPANLAPGSYYGQVQVTSPTADNSPQMVSVVLNVLPPGSKPGPIVQPTSLIFSAVAGGVSPSSQDLLVSNLGGTSLSFGTGRVTADGRDWFVTLPTDAAVANDRSTRIVVQPKIENLSPGAYRGTLTLVFSDGNTRTVRLLFIVLPAVASTPKADFRLAQTDCVPTKLLPEFTLLSDGFSIPAGWPNLMEMRVVDDCANPMVTGTAVATFQPQQPAVALVSSKDGRWTASWQPQAQGGGPTTITGTAEIPEQKLTGNTKVTGGLQASASSAALNSGAVVNAASFARQGPLAPGSLVSVFGTKLSSGENHASNLPLPANLGGSTVIVGGRPVPLLYSSDGQVNAQIPYGVPVNTRLQAIIAAGGAITAPEPITIAPAAPGVFTWDSSGRGQGIIMGVDETGREVIANAARPVKAGDAVVIYCTGLGEVNQPVAAGAAAPSSPTATTVNQVAVTIGGQPATVFYSGLVAGFAGLYQVNAYIPQGVTAGPEVPVTLTVAGQVSAPVTIAVQ